MYVVVKWGEVSTIIFVSRNTGFFRAHLDAVTNHCQDVCSVVTRPQVTQYFLMLRLKPLSGYL